MGLPVVPATAFPKEFEAEKYVDRRLVRKSSNQVRLAIVAAKLAAEGLPEDEALRENTAVIVGTCFGSSDYYLKFHEGIRRKGLSAANAVLFTEGVFNAAPGHISKMLAVRGPGIAIVGGEEAGLSAVVTAADRVRLRTVRAALAGGAEEYCDRVYASLEGEQRVGDALGGLTAEAPSLFAEGAAMVCVEPLDAVVARGGVVYAEILGCARARPGSGGEADPAPIVRAARSVLAQAGRSVGDLGLIVGGGCGGPVAARELVAVAGLLGDVECAYWAPKTLVGEGFGFTSALLAVAGGLAVAKGVVPPTFKGDDAGARPLAKETVLVVASSGPGGAVALLLGKP
jgi:3-oxoacyl-(acyl-carrier-protein) synthase